MQKQEDANAHDILLCVKDGEKASNANRSRSRISLRHYQIKSIILSQQDEYEDPCFRMFLKLFYQCKRGY